MNRGALILVSCAVISTATYIAKTTGVIGPKPARYQFSVEEGKTFRLDTVTGEVDTIWGMGKDQLGEPIKVGRFTVQEVQ